ncbi:MAG TPA: DUF2480 family protein [Flavipsychrobacter sp.]|nr:DUF2480 family protein [Flavipsychrobacter sp.]
METIVNKVAESGIITLDLSSYLPTKESIAVFDLKPFLFREMILREKEYRAALQTFDWQQFENKHVAISCSVEAIIPVWAYMLAASYLQPFASSIYLGSVDDLKKQYLISSLSAINREDFEGKRVVIKGCGEIPVPYTAYVAITALLRPYVKSLMYGEPCSTVPIYKKK